MEKISKHIHHWANGAIESIETAEILINKRKILFGLFFCHLAIEKQLKALFIKTKKDFPPKTHNLLFLANKCNLELNDTIKLLFSKLMKFQLEGRYPEIIQKTPTFEKSLTLLKETKETLNWLQKTLQK